MIYATDSSYFNSFLTTGRHKPTNEEVVEALDDIKKKVRRAPPPPRRAAAADRPRPIPQNKGASPEEMAATLRNKSGRAASVTVTGRGGRDGANTPQVPDLGVRRHGLGWFERHDGRRLGARGRPAGGISRSARRAGMPRHACARPPPARRAKVTGANRARRAGARTARMDDAQGRPARMTPSTLTPSMSTSTLSVA